MHSSQISVEIVRDIALAAIEAVARPQGWTDLCDRLVDVLEAKAFTMLAYDQFNHTMPKLFASKACHTPEGLAIIRDLQSGGGEEDAILYDKIATTQPGRVMSEHELYGVPENTPLPDNAMRDKVLGVTTGKARCLMKVNDIGPFLDCVAVHDSRPYEGVPPLHDIAPFIAPILARAIETKRIVSALIENYDRLMTLFDRLYFGAAFCTPLSHVITANSTFQNITREHDGLRESSTGLQGASNYIVMHTCILSASNYSMLHTTAKHIHENRFTLPNRTNNLPRPAAPASRRERLRPDGKRRGAETKRAHIYLRQVSDRN